MQLSHLDNFWINLPILRKLKAAVKLIRPELAIIAGGCTWIGAVISPGFTPPLARLLAGFAISFFLSASALIFNDVFDLEVDRINAPQRTLPSGDLSLRSAQLLGIACALAGLGFAVWCSIPILFTSLGIWILGFLYNWRIKSTGLLGNLFVSTSVAATFLIGGMLSGDVPSWPVWMCSLIIFLFNLAEEIAADTFDRDGDLLRGSQSIAIRLGKAFALRTAVIIFGIAILSSLAFAWFAQIKLAAWICLGITIVVILFFINRLLRSSDQPLGRQAIRGIYLSASLGLAALFIINLI